MFSKKKRKLEQKVLDKLKTTEDEIAFLQQEGDYLLNAEFNAKNFGARENRFFIEVIHHRESKTFILVRIILKGLHKQLSCKGLPAPFLVQQDELFVLIQCFESILDGKSGRLPKDLFPLPRNL